jgi:hypothetical protein
LGGKTAQKITTGILRRLLSKELAIRTNFSGAGGKIAFGKLKLNNLVIGEAKM